MEPIATAAHDLVPIPMPTRRERLLAAMATVVREEGYGAASVSKVVAAAGVSRNTFYEHFANKEECFLAAYDAAVEQVLGRVRAASATATTRQAALEAGFAAFLGFAASERELAWLCVVEVLAAGPRALARRDEAMRRFADFLADGCAETDAGGSEVDAAAIPPLLTEVVVGGIYEVIYARILKGEAALLPELLPDIMFVWLAPFAGAVRASAARAEAGRRIGVPRDALHVAPEPGRSTRT